MRRYNITYSPDGEYMARVCFNTLKPYVAVEVLPEGIKLTGVNKPVRGQFFFKRDAQQRRIYVPRVLIDGYEEFVGIHDGDNNTEKDCVIYMKKKDGFKFSLPYGCSYSCKDIDPYQYNNPVKVEKLSYLHSRIKRERKEKVTYLVTAVISDKQRYCIVTKNPANPEKYISVAEAEYNFGKKINLFYKGTMQYVCQDKVRVPGCFANGISEFIIRKNADETSLLITPATEDCMVDNQPIDPAQFKGKEAVICPECEGETLKEIKKAFAEFTEVVNLLTEEIKNLKEENDRLKESNKAYRAFVQKHADKLPELLS